MKPKECFLFTVNSSPRYLKLAFS